MDPLRKLIVEGEDFLMERILHYARTKDYSRYTSTLLEAWRASIVGLSDCFLEAVGLPLEDLEPHPDDDFKTDPLACFGVIEARMHRRRGISLMQFLGLMKYYRRCYDELVCSGNLPDDELADARQRILLFFDRVEIAFCSEWATSEEDGKLSELQDGNRWLTNEKNLYLTIFESLDSPVLLLDEAGTLLNMNLSAQWLLIGPDTRGSYYYQPGDVEIWPWLREELSLLNAEGSTRRDLVRYIENPGGQGTYHVRLQKLLDISNKFNGTVVLFSDISELQQLNESYARSNRELQRYAGVISHDLRAPLRSVHSFLDLLNNRCQEQLSEEGREYLKYARDGAVRMGKMVAGLLTLAMIGKKTQVLKPVDLQHLIVSLRQELQATLSEAGAVLDVDPLPLAAGDSVLLSQLFQNLILNSIRYARPGVAPRIDVSGSQCDGKVVIRVADNGLGIPEESLDKIFDPFFRLRQDDEEGLGLGLSICQRIAEYHGGEILAERGVAEGAVIRVILPVYT